MKQPIGYNDGSGRLRKLLKSLHSLKQTSCCRNKKITLFLKKFDFKVNNADPSVFVCNGEYGIIILAIFVDGML